MTTASMLSAAAGFAGKALWDMGKTVVNKIRGDDGIKKNIGNAAGVVMSKLPGRNIVSNATAKLANVAEQVYGHNNDTVRNIRNFVDTTKTGQAVWNPVAPNDIGFPGIASFQSGALVPYTGNLYGTNFRKVRRMKFRRKKRNTLGFKHRVSKF